MQLYTDVHSIYLPGPTFLTIGNFDGLHRGHQMLLRRLREAADDATRWTVDPTRHAQTALLTFDPHPLAILRPAEPLHLLTTPHERLELASTLGIDVGILMPFRLETAQLRAVDFMTLMKEHLGLAGLVVGPDFALGKGRSGNIDRLRELGAELGYEVTVIDPVAQGDTAVRSSAIRQLLGRGDVRTAADLLGRYYHAVGTVIVGDRLGHRLGIPTANLATPANKLLPRDGVYATCTALCDANGHPDPTRTYNSVTNLGVRPTINGRQHRFETHLLDFPHPGHSYNLYEQTLRVEFVARLRDEQTFSGIDALVAQIQNDIAQARCIFQQS